MPATPFDLVVVGAGIVGAMTARLGAEAHPDWRILVLERSVVAGGASRYSAGLDYPYGSTERRVRMTQQSRPVYHRLRGQHPRLPIRDLPLVAVTCGRAAEAHRRRFTAELSPLDGRRRARLLAYGVTAAAADRHLWLCDVSAQHADVAGVAATLVAWATAGGRVECWEGVPIERVAPRDDGCVLSTSDGRTIHARRVIMATGPWGVTDPHVPFVRAGGVRVKKVVAFHVHRCPPRQAPVVCFLDEDAFLLPVPRHRHWILSVTAEIWDCRPDVDALHVTAADRAQALEILERYAPDLVPACHSGRAFCDAFGPGREPVVVRHPEHPALVYAGAGSGSGFRLAPAIAHEALDSFTV